jgi:hypothetical protein
MRYRVVIAVILACVSQLSMASDWRNPWVQVHDPQEAAVNSDEYAWRLFVAVNWPADTRTRTANPSASLGADQPVVWETWQNAADVFLDDGREPSPWTRGEPQPPIANERRFETGLLKDLANPRHIVGGRMVPLLDPVANAKRLTEIRMNRATFDYIRARGLYNEDGQLRALVSGSPVHFPPGSTDIKAKWRPITEAERAHYHTLVVTLSDGSQRLYGLAALHIAVKDLEHWFWATFEHVDNQTLADDEGWQLPSRDTFACREEAADCNAAPRGIGLENTVWQNYRLRGTLVRFVDTQNRPLLLANSELEAGMQTTSSCITCHSRASIGIVAGTPTRLPIFQSAENEFPTRRGYVGTPDAEWFARSDDGARPLFQQLDFVWSLSKAHPRSIP